MSQNGVVIKETTSLCGICKQGIPAKIMEREGKIFLDKFCTEHGLQNSMIASNAEWYHDIHQFPAALQPPRAPKKQVETGCPYDCGACTSHEQKTYLPVIPITSSCNLNCPICYTINKNEDAYHMSLEEFGKILEGLKKNDPDSQLINFTGGEPTLHPQFREMIHMCHDAGIHRITISTHGLTFLKHEDLLAELGEMKARIVLSFNSFETETWEKMIGAKVLESKLKVLELLEKYNVDTTLLSVIGTGCNEQELGRLLEYVLDKDFVRSLEIHTMTFTGQGGRNFDPTARVTTPDILKLIEDSSKGRIRLSDFVPSPCAHPLCYQIAYLLDLGDKDFLPFTRLMSKADLRSLLEGSLYMEPSAQMNRLLQDAIMELWSADIPAEMNEKVLATLKRMLKELFPTPPLSYAERQVISERSVKAIYLHSHMDEDTFDTDRIRQCCVGVPDAQGGNIPTCSYNILYRERDSRFSTKETSALSAFQGGAKWGSP